VEKSGPPRVKLFYLHFVLSNGRRQRKKVRPTLFLFRVFFIHFFFLPLLVVSSLFCRKMHKFYGSIKVFVGKTLHLSCRKGFTMMRYMRHAPLELSKWACRALNISGISLGEHNIPENWFWGALQTFLFLFLFSFFFGQNVTLSQSVKHGGYLTPESNFRLTTLND